VTRLFSTHEKDAIRQRAWKAYVDCYGPPSRDREGDVERYYVSKGIEAMSAVLYTEFEDKLRELGAEVE
jgi:23S rRNA maturation mini-RNase III